MNKREKVARAIAESDGHDWDTCSQSQREEYLDNADAAIAVLEAQLAKADALAELLDTPDQSEGRLGQYHYTWERVDAALTEYRAARETDT